MKYAVVPLALALLATVALGDVVHLKNGGSIEGQVVPAEDGIILKLPAGEVRISHEAIDRIEKKASPLDEYQKRLAQLDADDVNAQYKLGLWARANGLKGQAKRHFEKAIAIYPDHGAARQALGYRRVGDQWLNEDEEMRARGLVRFDGQWMAPEAAARLKALQAELALARERRIAAEAELQKARDQARRATQTPPPDQMPIYKPNPWDIYYSTRGFQGSRTYYWAPPYNAPYYSGPYGAWWFYPGGRRYIPRSIR